MPEEQTATETAPEPQLPLAEDTALVNEPEPQAPAPAPQVKTPAIPVPDPEIVFRQKYQVDALSQRAQAFDQLVADPDFQALYRRKVTGQSADQPLELSDEEFQAAQQDKAKFMGVVEKVATRIAESKIAPQLQATQQQLVQMRREQDILSTWERHPDFGDLDQAGLIEPLMRQYPQLGAEEIYAIAAYKAYGWTPPAKKGADPQGRPQPVAGQRPPQQEPTLEEARARRRAMVEKPSSVSARRNVVEVADREEAMMLAVEAYKNGQEPPEFEIKPKRR